MEQRRGERERGEGRGGSGERRIGRKMPLIDS